jgi:hypothetical protein
MISIKSLFQKCLLQSPENGNVFEDGQKLKLKAPIPNKKK